MTAAGVPSAALETRISAAAARLGPFAGRIRHLSAVGSTNDALAELADRGAPHGTVVVADVQSAGRGRHGRHWFSPPGTGLYLSILLRAAPPPVLTLAVGVAVAEALRTTAGLQVMLEWPNDVVAVAGRRARKVAGILTEAATERDGATRIVVGIGINLRDAAWPPELAGRAGSVEGLTGRPVDDGALLLEVLAAVAGRCAELEAGAQAAVLSRWTALAPASRGASVEWSVGSVRYRGISAGIDGDGALMVRIGSRLERLTGGEVRHIRQA